MEAETLQLDRSQISRDSLVIFMANCRSHIVGALSVSPSIPEELHIDDAREIYAELRREMIEDWDDLMFLKRETDAKASTKPDPDQRRFRR